MDDLKDAVKVIVQTLEHVIEVVDDQQKTISELLGIVRDIGAREQRDALATSELISAYGSLVEHLAERGQVDSEIARNLIHKLKDTLIGGEDGRH